MKVTFQFSGGLELVTETTETIAEIDATEMKMSDIIPYVQKNFVKSQSQPFIKGNTVFVSPLPSLFFQNPISHIVLMCRCPGILVLINDSDWELEGGLDYMVQNRDTITFITTLHGG